MPTMKAVVQKVNVGMRPKMCDRAANGGWNIDELRRKLVPVQKASIAEPWRLAANFYDRDVSKAVAIINAI